MKYKNMIRFLSVLLCAVLLLTSCDSTRDGDDSTVTTEPTVTTTPEAPEGPVEPVLENFFTILPSESAVILKDAKRLDGVVNSYDERIPVVVLRDAKINAMNQVTEIFSVYNVREEKVVATFENTYSYGSEAFDGWPAQRQEFLMETMIYDDSRPYQESTMDVTVENAFGILPYIMVKRAILTEIDEQVREENEDGCAYNVALSYEYYDITGQKIAESKLPLAVYPYNFAVMGDVDLLMGDMIASFDFETGKLLHTQKGIGTSTVGCYSLETEKYGYFYDEQDTAMWKSVSYIEVFDKSTGERILRHNIGCLDYDPSIGILANGNIFVQKRIEIDERSNEVYDYVTDYGDKIKLESYIVNVETGESKDLAFGALASTIIPREIIEERGALSGDFPVALTNNVVNIGTIQRIDNKKLQNPVIVCLDHDLNVVYEFSPIVPEHKMNNYNGLLDFGFEILPGGDYLVNLYDVVTPRAIVSRDGKLRSYLKDTDYIAGDFVVNTVGIFDFDGKELYAFDEDSEWKFEYVFADHIVVSRTNEVDPTDPDEIFKTYCTLTYENGAFAEKVWYRDQNLASADEAFLITQDDDNGKYTLYNTAKEHVLTTADRITVLHVDGKYIALTTVDGAQICYVLK